MLEKRDSGKEGCWKGGMQKRKDVGNEEFRKPGMLEKRDSGRRGVGRKNVPF